MHLEQVCFAWYGRASEAKHEMYSVTEDLALYWLSSLWKSNLFLTNLDRKTSFKG